MPLLPIAKTIFAILPALLLGVSLAALAPGGYAPAQAQQLVQTASQAASGGTEEDGEAPIVVRGKYTAGELTAEWEATVEDGKPTRIAEWRRYGEHGDASVIFDFHRGDLMHYGERGRRVAGQAGVADGYRKVNLNLNFAQGRFTHGRKQVDGIDTEPDEPEVQAAMVQAKAALERLASTRSAWSERGSGGAVNFSRHNGTPQGGLPESSRLQAAAPPPEQRTRPGEVAFRCAEGLRVVLGAGTARQADSLIVEQDGRPPAPLLRQPPDGRYEYLGRGWAATRFGEHIRLDSSGGQAWDCNVVAAVPPKADVPDNPVVRSEPLKPEPARPEALRPDAARNEPLPVIDVPAKR